MHQGCPKYVETCPVSEPRGRKLETRIREALHLPLQQTNWYEVDRTPSALHLRLGEEKTIPWEGSGWGDSAGTLVFFLLEMDLAIKFTEWTSINNTTSYTRSHITLDIVPPCFLRWATTAELLLIRTTDSLETLSRKAFKARMTAFISRTLMWRSISSWDQTPAAVRLRRWVPQPVREAIVYSRREGERTWRGTPDNHHSSHNHQWMHSTQSSVTGIWIIASSAAEDQKLFSCHWRGTSKNDLQETNRSRDTMWPSNCYHILVGGNGRRRNLSARSGTW